MGEPEDDGLGFFRGVVSAALIVLLLVVVFLVGLYVYDYQSLVAFSTVYGGVK